MRELILVDPALLHLPTGVRSEGADPAKLARQIAVFGDSLSSMPTIEVTRGKGGHFQINDGVTRATRAAKLCPNVLIQAEVIADIPNLDVTKTLTIQETL
jgi:hypothetical protein